MINNEHGLNAVVVILVMVVVVMTVVVLLMGFFAAHRGLGFTSILHI